MTVGLHTQECDFSLLSIVQFSILTVNAQMPELFLGETQMPSTALTQTLYRFLYNGHSGPTQWNTFNA